MSRLLPSAGAVSGWRPRTASGSAPARASSRRSTSSTSSAWPCPRPGARTSSTAFAPTTSASRGSRSTWRPPARRASRPRTGRGRPCPPASRAGRSRRSTTGADSGTARLRPGPRLVAGRNADPRRSLAGARGTSHRQVPQRSGVAASRASTAGTSSSSARPSASCSGSADIGTRRRGDRRPAGEEPRGHRAIEPPHDPRHLPRRPPRARSDGGVATGAGWGQHRMPIEGLYQTGGTTHPGARSPAPRGATRRARARRPRSRVGGGDRITVTDVHAHVIVAEIVRNGRNGRPVATRRVKRELEPAGGRAGRSRDSIDDARGGRRRDHPRLPGATRSIGCSRRGCRCSIPRPSRSHARALPDPERGSGGARASDADRIAALGAVPLQARSWPRRARLARGRRRALRSRGDGQRRRDLHRDPALRAFLGGGGAHLGRGPRAPHDAGLR